VHPSASQTLTIANVVRSLARSARQTHPQDAVASLCRSSCAAAGTLADILSPSRLVIFGTLLTTLNKPMFAASGYVFATFGTVSTLYWITAAKARRTQEPTIYWSQMQGI